MPNPERLKFLTIVDSEKIRSQNLSVFSRFINLSELCLIGVNFCDSLNYLSNLNSLFFLKIEGTELESDLESLPENLDFILCDNKLAKKKGLLGYEVIIIKHEEKSTRSWLMIINYIKLLLS